VAIAHFMENFANAQLLDVKITEGLALRAVTSLVVQI